VASDATAQLMELGTMVIGAAALVVLTICLAVVILRQGELPPGWR
jgi:hypothetical protein